MKQSTSKLPANYWNRAIINEGALKDAALTGAACEIVRGLGQWILQMERTEEEIARHSCREQLAIIVSENGLATWSKVHAAS